MTKTCKKAYVITPAIKSFTPLLKCLLYIHHPVKFKKDYIMVQASLDSGSEINVMTLANVAKLGIKFWSTNSSAQKIDDSTLSIADILFAKQELIWRSYTLTKALVTTKQM